MPQTCKQCGKPFELRRGWQVYCSGRCRNAAWVAKHPRVHASQDALSARHGIPKEGEARLDPDSGEIFDFRGGAWHRRES